MQTAIVASLVLALAVQGWAGEVEPTEASLLAAWEAQQRADPATSVFERTGERTYHFKTSRFPFDGELRVLNVFIDRDTPLPAGEGVVGVVEVELAGLPPDFRERHLHSFASWQGTHMLHFDADAGRWLTSREWRGSLMRQVRRPTAFARASQYFWFVLLAALLLFLFLMGRKANRQFKTAQAMQDRALAEHQRSLELVERSLAIAEDSNRVLHEILETLQSREAKAPMADSQ